MNVTMALILVIILLCAYIFGIKREPAEKEEMKTREQYRACLGNMHPETTSHFDVGNIRMARKKHKCHCGRTINSGEFYMNEREFEDGEVIVSKTCFHCMNKWMKERGMK